MKATTSPQRREIAVSTGERMLPGILSVPVHPRGVVVFAHGSGSSRLSPRNQAVSDRLVAAGFATLLFDLLEPAEETDRRNVFAVEMLAERLMGVCQWISNQPELWRLPVGYFGASTGAAAALIAAARRGECVSAVVSRGGRPDLAGPWLSAVVSPTLLIVGGDDVRVLELNEAALSELRCTKELVVVPGASHLFEESGTLEKVSELAAAWFASHLTPPAAP